MDETLQTVPRNRAEVARRWGGTLFRFCGGLTGAAFCCALAACATPYRVVSGDLEQPGLASYVVLWSVDPDTPAAPPTKCEERGVVAVPTCGEKCFPYSAFRKGAQRLRGNGVVDFRVEGKEHLGTVVQCSVAE